MFPEVNEAIMLISFVVQDLGAFGELLHLNIPLQLVRLVSGLRLSPQRTCSVDSMEANPVMHASCSPTNIVLT